MDNMGDSGFDSEPKVPLNGSTVKNESIENGTSFSKPGPVRKGENLQQKLADKQREAAKKIIEQQPKKANLLSRKRLPVPNKENTRRKSEAEEPLVAIDLQADSEDSDDEFAVVPLSQATGKEITQQLIRDGYNLDLLPDDEDLDLIPPRAVGERCTCCQVPVAVNCVVQ